MPSSAVRLAPEDTLLDALQGECDRTRIHAAKLRRQLDEERAHSAKLRDQLRQMTTTQQQLQQQLRLAVGTPNGSCASAQHTSIASLQRALEAERSKLDQAKLTNGELAAERKRLSAAQTTAAAERQRLMAANESLRVSLDRKDKELASTHAALRERSEALERATEQLTLQGRVHEAEQAQAIARYRELTLAVQRERQRALNRASRTAAIAERCTEEHYRALQSAASIGGGTGDVAGSHIIGCSNEPGADSEGKRVMLYMPPLDYEDPAASTLVALSADHKTADEPSGPSIESQALRHELERARASEHEAKRDAKEARLECERLRTQLRLMQHSLVDAQANRKYDAAHRHRERPRGRSASTSQLGDGRPATAGNLRSCQRTVPVILGQHTASLRRTIAAVQSAQRNLRDSSEGGESNASEGESTDCAIPDGEYFAAGGAAAAIRERATSAGGRNSARHSDSIETVPNAHVVDHLQDSRGHRAAPQFDQTQLGSQVDGSGRCAGSRGGGEANAHSVPKGEECDGRHDGAARRSGNAGGASGAGNGDTSTRGGNASAWHSGRSVLSARRSDGQRSARGGTTPPSRESLGARARSALEEIEASLARLESPGEVRGPPSPGKSILDVDLQ